MPYVIRNCPARLPSGFCIEAPKKKAYLCKDCTDCVMKQIVELCKKVQELEYQKGGVKYKSPSKAKFGREILQLLDIEEVE